MKNLLPPYSRRVSDGHLRLGLALEFHPDVEQRKHAKTHIEQAANVLRRRLVQLERVLSHEDKKPSDESANDHLWDLDEDQLRREKKDIEEMLKDLELKVCQSFY